MTATIVANEERRKVAGVWFRRVLEGAFWLVLLFSVTSYGGNNALSVTMSAAAGAFLLPLALLVAGAPYPARWPFWLAIALPLALVVWSWLQTIGLPGGLFANPVWLEISDTVGPLQAVISVTPGDVALACVKIALPFVIFLLALILFDTDKRAERALRNIALAGGLIALASIVQYLVAPEALIVETKRYYLDSLTAPFVNRNTAGTFYGVLTLTLFSLCWNAARVADLRRLFILFSMRRSISRERAVWRIVGYATLCLTALLALLLTHSRAAVGCTALAFLVLSVQLQRGSPLTWSTPGFTEARPRWGRRLLGLLLTIGAVALVLSLFGEQVLFRAQLRGLVDARFCIMPAIGEMIGGHWLAGVGLTSFRDLFPAYRDPVCGIVGVFDKAHNSYAEGLLTLGVVFPPVVATAVVALLVIYRKGYNARRRLRFVSAIGLCSLILTATHAAVDFSLQIPGFTTFFAALTATVVTICLNPSTRRRRSMLAPLART